MNISERMRSLLEVLENPFNGIDVHGVPECEDEWNEDYAIIKDFYWDNSEFDNDYVIFEENRFLQDLKYFVSNHFEIPVENVFINEAKSSGGITAIIYPRSQELEVYRK